MYPVDWSYRLYHVDSSCRNSCACSCRNSHVEQLVLASGEWPRLWEWLEWQSFEEVECMNACRWCFISLYGVSGWGTALVAKVNCHFWTVFPHYHLIINTLRNHPPCCRSVVNLFLSYYSSVFVLTIATCERTPSLTCYEWTKVAKLTDHHFTYKPTIP